MKKILYCASTTGHLRSFHLPYLRALLQAGHAATTAAAGAPDGLPEGVVHEAVPFTKSFASPRNLRAAFRLARLIRRERFDIILTHTSLAAFFTRVAVMLAGKRGVRVVNTVHGYLFDDDSAFLRRTVMLGAEKLTARVTDDILTMNACDERIAREHRLCRGRVVPIDGMGVALAGLHAASAGERTAAREALDIPADAFVLVYAAEFSARKGQRFLVESLAALPEDIWLLLPGEGALREECRALAERLGVAGRVLFPGFMQERGAYLQAADVCVSSSRSEGLPFHVMEAMACGLPSVLSRVKGHEDLMDGGSAGLLFAYDDADAFRRAVLQLRDDPALRARMGAAAAQAARRYDIERVLPQVIQYYQ